MSALVQLTVVDGRPTTTSVDVARHFGKRHDNVLREIQNICSELPEDRLLNFEETVIIRENPSGGAPIESPAYRLTRDAFSLLAFGFTGKKALQFKLAYIDEFNRMESALSSATARPVLPRPQPAYMAEAWFAILRHQAGCMVHRALARALQIHESTLSQVLGGTGHYGTGRCTTRRVAHRVLRVFCPRQRVHARQLSLV